MNSKQLTIAGLIARGFLEVAGASKKYRVFARTNVNRRYLVGHSGALRACDGSALSPSISLTGTRAHRAFQGVGEMAGGLTSVEQADAVFAEFQKHPIPVR